MSRSTNPSTAESDTIDAKSGSETERVARKIHEAIDRFAEHAADAEQRVRDAASEAEARLQSGKQTAKVKGTQAAAATENYIDEHPWAALGIAFGAGIVISSLLRR